MKNQEESKPIPTDVAEYREAHVLPVKEVYDAEPSEKHLKEYEKSLEEYQEFLWRCFHAPRPGIHIGRTPSEWRLVEGVEAEINFVQAERTRLINLILQVEDK